jgi:arylformamidase
VSDAQPDWIDVSVPVLNRMPVWPGSPPVELIRRLDLSRGDPVNDTTLRFSVHTGTHLDAPLHFLANGASVDNLRLDVLIGPAWVTDLPGAEAVTAELLEAAGVPAGVTRLLVRTRNSVHWERDASFRTDYAALTADAAQWVVDRGIQLIAVDYLSVQRFDDGPATHLILLGAGVVVVEGLNLAAVEQGEYDLLCLPLRLVGAEGAPARAVLRKR